MATVATTTNAAPLQYPPSSLMDMDNGTRYLYQMIKGSTANTYEVYRSTNAGVSWSLLATLTRTSVAELGPINVPRDGYLYFMYRTNESSEDRIYLRRLNLATATWGSELLVGSAGNGGSAGAVYQGIDFKSFQWGSYQWVPFAVATHISGRPGVVVNAVRITTATGAWAVMSSLFSGTRWWTQVATDIHNTPSLDYEHNGDNENGTPNLWVAFGPTDVRVVKLAWGANGWTGPSSSTRIIAATSDLYTTGRWDGQAFILAAHTADTAYIYERNAANTATAIRGPSPAHPAGVIREMTLNYNTITRDVRVYAIGTSSTVLYYCDYVRASDTWTSWGTVTATAVLGSTGSQFGVRRSTWGDAKHDVYTAHSGAPNTVVHTAQALSYAPNAPSWEYATSSTTPVASGQAFDIASVLTLDWAFSDPDDTDTQSAWAMSRQIGSGSLMYYRASDNTWQSTEQKNTGTTTSRNLSELLLSDAFNDRTVSGGWGGNWSTSPSGDTAVASGVGTHTHSSVNALRYSWIGTGTANQTLFFDVTIPVMPAGAPLSVWALARFTDVSNYYEATLLVAVGGAATLQLAKRVAGTLTSIGAAVSVGTHSAGATWRIGIVANGTNLLAKAWMPATQGEPNWQLSQTDSSLATGSSVGVTGRLETGNTNTLPVIYSFDNVTVGTGAGSAQSWAGPGDSAQTYKVKVWDSADLASSYSSGLVVIPSATVNPTITSPTTGAVLTSDAVTVTWTVGQQTAYRVQLKVLADVVFDSGWVTGTETSYTPDYPLGDGFSYAAVLQTRNAQGLASTAQQVTFSVDFIEPATPTLTVTPLPSSGVIRVVSDNPTPVGSQPAVSYQRLYRRPVVYPWLLVDGLETSLANWGTPVNGTQARSGTVVFKGSWALQLTATSTSAAYAESIKFPVTPGVEYWVDTRAAGPTTRNTYVQIRFYTAANAFISATNGIAKASPATNAYDPRWGIGTAPSNAATFTICLVLDTPTAGDIVYWDEIRYRVLDRTADTLVADGLGDDFTYDDWRATSGVEYEYRAETHSVIGTTVGGFYYS